VKNGETGDELSVATSSDAMPLFLLYKTPFAPFMTVGTLATGLIPMRWEDAVSEVSSVGQ
jgi:hypothetical protein